MPTLFDYLDSGNGYKVRLLLAHLGIPYDLVEVDIMKGETRTAQFLAMNPNGRIPTLKLDDGTCLAESNAIAWFLAEGTPWLPEDKVRRAQVLQWMFFEQYSHEPFVATARFILRHLAHDSPRRAELAERTRKGREAIAVMERHLDGRDWFVGSAPSVADVALYAYTHRADEAAIDLAPYPNVRAWLARFAALPGHLPMLA